MLVSIYYDQKYRNAVLQSPDLTFGSCGTFPGEDYIAPFVQYSNVTLAVWRAKPPTTALFAQQLVQADIKRDINAPYCWPFVRGIHHPRVVSLHACEELSYCLWC